MTPGSKAREISVGATVSLAMSGPGVVAIFSHPAAAVPWKCSGGGRCLAVSDNTGV